MSDSDNTPSDATETRGTGNAPPARRSTLTGASRTGATRHLLKPGQIHESLSLSSPPSLQTAALAGAQVALAVLIAMTITYLSPRADMVGFPALGGLAALFGRFASVSHRRRIVLVAGILLVAAVFIQSGASLLGASAPIMMLVLALIAGGSTIAASHWQLGGPGAVIIVFAAGASLAPAGSWEVVLDRTVATAFGALVAWLVCAVTDGMRNIPSPDTATHTPPFSHQLVAGARIAVGAGIAALIANAAGWHHPSWAAIGAVAVMQGVHLHIAMNRALQRMAGTVLGSIVAWYILAQEPSFWVLLGAIVILQFVTEVIIGFNYAFAQVTITPMALLMTWLASPSAGPDMPVERILETIVGAIIGILFSVLLSSLDERVHLHKLRTGSQE